MCHFSRGREKNTLLKTNLTIVTSKGCYFVASNLEMNETYYCYKMVKTCTLHVETRGTCACRLGPETRPQPFQSTPNNTGPLWNEVKFINRDLHCHIRRVKEAIHIRLHPNNISRGSVIEIPETWMFTIKKRNNA